jgi:hypothetical protein
MKNKRETKKEKEIKTNSKSKVGRIGKNRQIHGYGDRCALHR